MKETDGREFAKEQEKRTFVHEEAPTVVRDRRATRGCKDIVKVAPDPTLRAPKAGANDP